MTSSRNPNLGITASLPPELSGENWQQNLGHSRINLEVPRRNDWWTGLSPAQCPGFSGGKLLALRIPNLANCTRQEVLDYFNNGWTLTELLFSSLNGDEPFYRPPYHGLRHPLIFYFVHPAALYINKLRVAGLLDAAQNPYFESLFETGVDEMSWDDMSKNDIEWPLIDDAHAYRKQVYATIKTIIETHPGLADGHTTIHQSDPLWALFMGFEHERIHLETSSVLIRELPVHLLKRPAEWVENSPESQDADNFPPKTKVAFPENSFVEVNATTVSYGKLPDWPSFGWDNEYGNRTKRLSTFFASQFLISNGEFWQFVSEGGYHQQEFWTEEGWQWRSFRNVKWPSFWVPDGPAGTNQFKLRTCFEVVTMQWDWPAVVNFHEAKAYCKWKSARDGFNYRLITEAEHQALRQVCRLENENEKVLSVPQAYNISLKHGSESSVNESRVDGTSFFDVFGNVWQWCEDHFNPLSGSRVHRYYDDFSTPCYDGRHQMILGGSFASCGDEATPFARFHFRPHFFQHAGFRMVYTPDGSDGGVEYIGDSPDTSNPYESQDTFNEYMTLHFATPELQMPYDFGPKDACSYPQRCADIVIDWCKKLGIKQERALDVACAVGGATFRLAESFDHVIGVDLSKRFIDAAVELKKKHELEFNSKIEGNILTKQKAIITSEAAERTEFRQADACALPAEYQDFDAVLLANLLCRLVSPSACLSRMWGSRGIVRPGGLLVTVSPYTWMEKFTPPDVWLGGYKDENGNLCYSEDGLKKMLGDHFDLKASFDVPLIIREHRRKYQYIVSQAMIWQRRA